MVGCLVGMARAEEIQDAVPIPAVEILRAAFDNLYDRDTTSDIELIIRNSAGNERRREFESASKRIDGRLRSIGRLVWPPHLRGMSLMVVENEDRSTDSFVYLPSLNRVRRIARAQRDEPFLGSDLTYEDFERRWVEDYHVDSARDDRVHGESVHVIYGRPIERVGYQFVEFVVAKKDSVLLETRYIKREGEAPFRVVRALRESMLESDGHILPTHILVRNESRNTTTEVRFRNLRVNPEIRDRIFTVGHLERNRPLPEVKEQGVN